MDFGQLYAGLNALDVAMVKRNPDGTFAGLKEGSETLGIPTVKVNPVTGGIKVKSGEADIAGMSSMSLDRARPNLSIYPNQPETPAWKHLQTSRPWSAPISPIGSPLINEFVCAGEAGSTMAVDTTVLFDGQPTTKVTINGTPSGALCSVGTTGATFTLSVAAQRILTNTMTVAIKGPFSVISVKAYIGDAGYANFYDITSSTKVVDAAGWQYFQVDCTEAGIVGITGAPTLTSAKRVKLNITTSGILPGAGTEFWVAHVGATVRTKPTVVLTFDDGYDEWKTFLVPELKKRGLPASLGIDKAYVGTAGFLTLDDIRSIQADSSGLFEFVNHGLNNEAYVSVGLAKYLENIDACDALLASAGVPERSRKLHPYVQGSFDATLASALIAKGFTSAREVGAQNRSIFPLLAGVNASITYFQSNFAIPAGINMYNATTVAQAISYVEAAAAKGRVLFAMGHKFEAAAGVTAWVAGYDSAYGMLNFLDWLAAERDAGRLNVFKWSDYIALSGSGLDF